MEIIENDSRFVTPGHTFTVTHPLDIGCFIASMQSDDNKSIEEVLLIDDNFDATADSETCAAVMNAPLIKTIPYRQSEVKALTLTDEVRLAFGYFSTDKPLGDWFRTDNGCFRSLEGKTTADGRGIYRTDDGYLLEGTFVNGKLSGHGIIKQGSRLVYDGALTNGIYDGEGTLYYEDGNTYTGFFVKGIRHGNGTLVTCYGDYYIGEFNNDQLTENGQYFTEKGKVCKYHDIQYSSEAAKTLLRYKKIWMGLTVLFLAVLYFLSLYFILNRVSGLLLYVGISIVIAGFKILMSHGSYVEELENEKIYAAQFK